MRPFCICGLTVAVLLSASSALARDPVTVEGSFKPKSASLAGAIFVFSPLSDVAFSPTEKAAAGKWIGLRLASVKYGPGALRGERLTLAQDSGDPLQIVARPGSSRSAADILSSEMRSCFAAWYQSLSLADRLSLLGNFSGSPIPVEKMAQLSDALTTYIAMNREACAESQAEPDLYLDRRIAQYISLRNQDHAGESAYDSLLAQAYEAELAQLLQELREGSRGLISSWVTGVQRRAAPVDSASLADLFAEMASSQYDIPADIFVYRMLTLFTERTPSLQEAASAKDINPFVPYLVAAQDILNACGSAHGFFAVRMCTKDTVNDRFTFLKVRRNGTSFTDFIAR